MCYRIVQKRREVNLWGQVVVLKKGEGEYDSTVVAVFRGSVSKESAENMKWKGGVEVIVPYVSGFDVRSENTGKLNRENVQPGSALLGILSGSKEIKGPVLHVIYENSTEEQLRRLGNDVVPVVLKRELEPHDWTRWQRCNPPTPNEPVWTTDQFTVQRGLYDFDPLNWDPEAEQEQGKWMDLAGSDLVVRYWMEIEDGNKIPQPPRLLYRHFELPVLKP